METKKFKNRPKNYMLNVRRQEILMAIASSNSNILIPEFSKDIQNLFYGYESYNKLVSYKYTNSTRKSIKALIKGQMTTWGILELYPEWLKPITNRENILQWEKNFENDMYNLHKSKVIYLGENKEWYMDIEWFRNQYKLNKLRGLQLGLNYYPYSYKGLAKINKDFNYEQIKVSEFYTKKWNKEKIIKQSNPNYNTNNIRSGLQYIGKGIHIILMTIKNKIINKPTIYNDWERNIDKTN